MTRDELKHLPIWANWIEGARALLLRMRDDNVCLFNDKHIKKAEQVVYNNAMYESLMDKSNLNHYLMQDAEGRFYDHQRDAKGKLVSCKFGFFKPLNLMQKV